MDLTRYVDPFLGNGEIDLPEPQGIAATWFFIKAQTGNTHPGAVSPLGMVSACPYSGAYVNGYGLNAPNSHARPPRRFEEYSASGFTHFHPSGTGAVEVYCNYYRVTPLVGGLSQLGTRWPLEQEEACPGYYSTRLAGTGIRAELTVTPKTAFHRYTFPQSGEACVAVDFSIGGLIFPERRTVPRRASLEVLAPGVARGCVLMEGIPVYIHIDAEGAATCNPFTGDTPQAGGSALALDRISPESLEPFGVVFGVQPRADHAFCLRLGFSFRGLDQARENLQEIAGRSFDQVAADLRQTWNQYLSRIVVEGCTGEQKRIFYSALYHSLIKPADCTGESPFWEGDSPYFVDFATLWDQYKTLIPLLLSVYPERGVDAISGMLSLSEHLGEFPNGVLLSSDFLRFENQARALSLHCLADAFHRRLSGIDWQHALDLMLADLHKERNRDFLEEGIAHPFTHTLDLADACACAWWIAGHVGDEGAAAELAALSRQWRNVYDPETGRLGESKYYEGGAWNYSFRLLHDMAGRIGLYPSEEAFVTDLDQFFGYGQPPIEQAVDPADRDCMQRGFALNRFEGLNNEPDIEVPYAYLYAGRHDRTAEIVRAGMKYMFTTGRGGLPGNDDSGGTSSWYVWNAVGLYPVPGHPALLIGSPIFDRASIQLGGNVFEVQAKGNSEECIYVQRATLNGENLDRAYLTMDEAQAGGVLELVMGAEPTDWASDHRPPSYPL